MRKRKVEVSELIERFSGGISQLKALEFFAALELRNRLGYWYHFRDFIRNVNPEYKFYKHCSILVDVLQRVAIGELKRVIFLLPFRHSKSETVSRLFSSYYITRYPHHSVSIVSYSASLAEGFSRNAREYYLRDGHRLKSDLHGIQEWGTPAGGVFWVAGLEGTILGRGFHLGIIDDPLNIDASRSKSERDKVWDNFVNAFFTRREPNAAIIIVATRMHDDDIVGRLLRQEEVNPQHWYIVCFPADKRANPEQFPKTTTLCPDWRDSDGIALCPERFSIEQLRAIEAMEGMNFDAYYRQNPIPKSGALWNKHSFKTFTEIPCAVLYDEYTWDTAYTTKRDNSASAFVRTAVGEDGNIYVLDCGWNWLEFPQLKEWIMSYGGTHFIEGKASGKSLIQTLRAEGITVFEIDNFKESDEERTKSAAIVADAGKVFVHEKIYTKLLEDEDQGILRFPYSRYSDLNDALTHAINRRKNLLFSLKQKPLEQQQQLSPLEIMYNYVEEYNQLNESYIIV